MPRLFGIGSRGRPLADPSEVRAYTKQDVDYWERPGLADKITEAVQGGLYSYEELKEWAESQGYSERSFVQTVSNLRMDGVIDTHCGGLYPADDPGDWDLV